MNAKISIFDYKWNVMRSCDDAFRKTEIGWLDIEDYLKEIGKEEYTPYKTSKVLSIEVNNVGDLDKVSNWHKNFLDAMLEAVKLDGKKKKVKVQKFNQSENQEQKNSEQLKKTEEKVNKEKTEINNLNVKVDITIQGDPKKDTPNPSPSPNNNDDWQKNFDEKAKKEYIGDVELRLARENVSSDRLSKRLGVSDWREKINNATGWRDALNKKSDIWDIIRKMKDEYTCAKCGKEGESYSPYYVGNQKCCSWECEKALKGEEEGTPQIKDTPSNVEKIKESKSRNFGFSSMEDFFTWWNKLGVTRIEWDFKNNKLVIECGNNQKLDLSQSGLSSKQQQELSSAAKASQKPLVYKEIKEIESDSNNHRKSKNNVGSGAIVGAIVVVGLLFTAVISIVLYKSRSRD